MTQYLLLSKFFNGWTLTEIKELSIRERTNWVNVVKEYGKAMNS